MLRFGTAGIPLSSEKRDTISGIKRVYELGLNAMEVEFVRGVRMGIESAKNVREVAEKLNVSLSTHAPYFINLASEDEKKRKKSITFITNTARIADALGAKIVVFHPGYYYKKDRDKTFSLMLGNIKKAKEIVEKNGWDVLLAPEVMGRQATFGGLDETIKICKEACVVPTIDFAHIHARGNGCLKTKDDFRKVFDKLKKLKLKNFHMHFTGVKYKDGNEKKHLVLKEGDLDFGLLAPVLAERKINGTIINESPNLEVDALEMKRVYKRMKYHSAL